MYLDMSNCRWPLPRQREYVHTQYSVDRYPNLAMAARNTLADSKVPSLLRKTLKALVQCTWVTET